MIKKAIEVANAVCYDELRNPARHITADRLAIVERLRELSCGAVDAEARALILELEIKEAEK